MPTTLTTEQKIKALERKLEEMQLKADFFEAVIKVMDHDFGVHLSKKRKAELLRKNAHKTYGNQSLPVYWDYYTSQRSSEHHQLIECKHLLPAY